MPSGSSSGERTTPSWDVVCPVCGARCDPGYGPTFALLFGGVPTACAASLRCQASSVAGVTGKTPAQRRAGAGSDGSHTAHSAPVMSEG